MALGGIPVSGGETGHGTIISCNLLYSPLLYDSYGLPLPRPAYTLGGDAGVAGYEAAFVIDGDPKTLWKTPASTNDLAITMIHGASPPMVYGVALIGHNIVAADVSLAKFEGGMDTNYNTVSEDLVLNAATLTPAYCLLATPVAHDHWRIRVNFAASTALQIGEVFLIGAAPYVFAKNYNKGFTPDLEFGKTTSDGIPGVPRVATRWERKRYSFQFTEITEAQLTVFQDAARNGHVIFSPKGVNGKALFGVIQVEPPKYITEVDSGSIYDVVANFIEAAR